MTQSSITPSPRLRCAESVVDLVGQTPMLHLRSVGPAGGADIYAKLEYLNPGGSVKDRAALGMLRRAEQEGRLKPGSTILEATAGNTGIGLALIGVSKGYRVILCVPENFSEEKVKVMTALGAQVIRTPASENMEGAIAKVQELAKTTPDSFMPMQFENQANPEYHYETTAPEMFEQMEGRIDAIVVGVGTGGTFSGVSRFLKERLRTVRTVAVETQGSVLQGGIPGPHCIEGIGVSFIPKTFHREYCDEIIMVKDEDAFRTVKELAAKEGVLSGSSGGANVFAAIQVARRLGKGKRVVTVVPDSAERYFSKSIFGVGRGSY